MAAKTQSRTAKDKKAAELVDCPFRWLQDGHDKDKKIGMMGHRVSRDGMVWKWKINAYRWEKHERTVFIPKERRAHYVELLEEAARDMGLGGEVVYKTYGMSLAVDCYAMDRLVDAEVCAELWERVKGLEKKYAEQLVAYKARQFVA